MKDKWPIRQMTITGGAHLPKLRKWNESKAVYTGRTVHHSHFPIVTPYGPHVSTYEPRRTGIKQGEENDGNLPKQEYRFYLGHPDKHSTYSQCRVCLMVCKSRVEREDHQDKTGCCTIMVKAMGQLPKKCVVCGIPTDNKKWGLPLCASRLSTCMELWKFELAQPTSLRELMLELVAEVAENVALLTPKD